MSKVSLLLIGIMLSVGLSGGTMAQTLVTDVGELQAAIDTLSSGSEIILKSKIWSDVKIDLNVEGTAERPVIIRAEAAGTVFFEGNTKVQLGGSYIKFDGVVFRNPSGLVVSDDRIDPIIEFRDSDKNVCNNCTVTNITIDSYNGTEAQAEAVFKWIIVYGQNNEISYSSFVGKYGVGSIINDNRDDSDPDFTRIHHNYLADRKPVGEMNDLNDQDAIRIGNSSTSLSDSYTQVYENYFDNWSGEIEIISNKSGKNKYYNNTFRNYQGSLTLRHGDNCEVYGNYFFASQNNTTAGIRVIGEGHLVYNNYIEGVNSKKAGGSTSGATGGINITNGRPDTELNGYYQVKDAKIVNNTFVDCDLAIRVGTQVKSDLTLAPENLEIANNIMLNSSSKAISENTAPIGNSTYTGNITQNGDWDITLGTNGNIESASGLLEQGTDFYRLVAGSAAIDAGQDSYAFLTKDILGGERPSAFDAGAEEFGANGERKPFVEGDVGVLVGFGAGTNGEIPAELSASVSSLSFESDSAEISFNVFSNVSWEVSSDATWLIVNPESGSNSGVVTATVSKNTALEERSATLTISEVGGSEEVKVTVSQSGETSDVVGLDKNQLADLGLSVYPNPVRNGQLRISSEQKLIEHVQVVDLAGKVLVEQKMKSKEVLLDVSKLTSGMYIVILPGLGSQQILIKNN
ncbi:chondroitinase-B domain-containing protein [Flammeovirgaceae bacterium SG7u.111]|nr:chondroitinase-B domain-containing protein [Flammeovirgaceae bacterium SG7u.132]WPO37584.1 chondroitinase-B domain-containing protein [Flammeovirgaceae bacterium SG7u.111]